MLNRVMLIGNLGQDPEIRSTQSGDRVCNLSVATTEKWTKDGQQREKTEWHRVTVWGKLVDVIEKYARKGSRLYLSGKLQTRKWQDQSGNDRYSTEVVLSGFNSELVLLDARHVGREPDRTPEEIQEELGGLNKMDEEEDFDDEIPFALWGDWPKARYF